MRLVLSKTAVLFHLALLVVFLGSGYCRAGDTATYLPLVWLVLGLLEMVLLFPPALKGETIGASRARAWRRMQRDPVFYLGLAGLLFLGVQSLNGPRAFAFDSAAAVWQMGLPPVPGMPSSVNRIEAVQGVFWFGPAWAAILAVRHGLTRRAKSRLLFVLAGFAGLLALISLVQYAGGVAWLTWGATPGEQRFGTFEYAGFAGAYFGMMFFVCGGLLVEALMAQGSRSRIRLLLAATLVNLLAATFTLDAGALMFVWGGGLAGFLYAAVLVHQNLFGADRLRVFIGAVLVLGALAFLHYVAYPENAAHARAREIVTGEALDNPAERSVLRRAAWRIFLANPAYGTGTWGFRHAVGHVLDDDDWAAIGPDNQMPVSSQCDPLQTLCEYGVFGTGLLLACTLWLVIPAVRNLVRLAAHAAPAPGIEAARLKRIPPVAVATGIALGGAVVLSLFGMPFRNPLVLVNGCMLLALLPGLLPVPRAVAGTAASAAPPAEPPRRPRLFGWLPKDHRGRRHPRHHQA